MEPITNRDEWTDRRVAEIRRWGLALGFQQIGISTITLDDDDHHLQAWLRRGRQGEMAYMERHRDARGHPERLVPGTVSVICARMDYLPAGGADPMTVLADTERAYVSRYALGRDYHKLMRRRLQRLATRITEAYGPFGYRCFCDSAPVLEKALAAQAGIGWIGKHTNLLHRDYGSWFFLGEIYTDLPLPPDRATENHCGRCTACLEACPTRAIVAPYELDARRCISYLTIELRGNIPLEFRAAIGNRIYGCDDCQLVCPWNRFARLSREMDFSPRHGLDARRLTEVFAWTEAEFLKYTEGSAIRRIGYLYWLRNIAVALGNALRSAEGDTATTIVASLDQRRDHPSAMLREHVQWALAQRGQPTAEEAIR